LAPTFFSSLSIWNTMMGTSLLSVPWALSQSGLGTGLAIAFAMAMLAAYTSGIILKTHRKESETKGCQIFLCTNYQNG
jgi:sodium-coupled neutral amino acid transporter 9